MSETSSRFSRFSRQERESSINGSSSIFDEEFDDIEQEIQPLDYYGIMNVSRTSDDNEIKNAYKRLCLTFHPDKQPDEQKAYAEEKFHLIQKAYHVLSDPNKRHIYDLYGEGGLQDLTWDLTVPKSKEALLLEFEHRAKLKRELEEQTRVKSKGEIIIAIDATRLFRDNKRVKRKSRGLAEIFDWKNLPEFQHALVVHSWETRYDDNNTVSLKGNVISKNGLGQGGVTLGLRHIASPTLWGEATATLGDQSNIKLSVVNNFSPEMYMTGSVGLSSLEGPLETTILFGKKISMNSTGYISYSRDFSNLFGIDNRSNCVIGMVHRLDDITSSINLNASVGETSISLSQSRPIGPFRAKSEIKAGPNGVSVGVTGDKKIDKVTRLGLGVECGPIGVSLKFKYFRLTRISRLGQKVSLPILLSENMDFKLAFLTFFVPVAGYVVLDTFVFKAWNEKLRKEHLEKIRRENAEILEQRRLEAEAAVSLLSESIGRKMDSEENGDGLVIISALYGNLPPSNLDSIRVLTPEGIQELAQSIKAQFKFLKSSNMPISARKDFIDVTIAVQSLVTNSQLHISGGHSKSNLIGFYDPCYGEKKQLRIIYQFQGRLHEVTVGDKQPVAAPLRAHFVCV